MIMWSKNTYLQAKILACGSKPSQQPKDSHMKVGNYNYKYILVDLGICDTSC